MTALQTLIAHLFVVGVVVAAALALAVTGHIDGATAIGMISAVMGISLGVGATSIGALSIPPAAKVTEPSSGTGAAPTPGG